MKVKVKYMLMSLVLLIVLFLTLKGCSMKWKRAPYYSISNKEGDDFSTDAFQITTGGQGFLGGYAFNSDEDFKFTDFRQDIAVHKALIQKTADNWKTRTTVFEGNGEIEEFFNIGNGRVLARNKQADQETLLSRTQILTNIGLSWQEISKLDFYVKKIYGSESPWLVAIGFPNESRGTVYIMVSSSGAKNWDRVQLEGFTSPDIVDEIALTLSKFGKLYRFSSFQLDFVDLNRTEAMYHWNLLSKAPSPLRRPFMLLQENRLSVIGNTSDSSFGIWNISADGTGPNAIQECTGIPKEFSIDRFECRRDALYLVGSTLIKRDGEVRGVECYLLKSDLAGKHWVDIHLPITSSLQAVDFGEDGSIWASAPGNRIQVFSGNEKN